MIKLLLLCILANPAVVRVEAVEGGGSSLGSGTCIAATDKSLIVTAWHVVRDSRGPYRINKLPATLVATDKTWDLALLVVDSRLPSARLSNTPPNIGESLTVCGFGSGSYREATGIIRQFLSPGGSEPADIVAMDAAARSGDSGGPMFDSNGMIVAVLFGSDKLGAHGSHCMRVRWFIKKLQGYDDLKQLALRDYVLYGR